MSSSQRTKVENELELQSILWSCKPHFCCASLVPFVSAGPLSTHLTGTNVTFEMALISMKYF